MPDRANFWQRTGALATRIELSIPPKEALARLRARRDPIWAWFGKKLTMGLFLGRNGRVYRRGWRSRYATAAISVRRQPGGSVVIVRRAGRVGWFAFALAWASVPTYALVQAATGNGLGLNAVLFSLAMIAVLGVMVLFDLAQGGEVYRDLLAWARKATADPPVWTS